FVSLAEIVLKILPAFVVGVAARSLRTIAHMTQLRGAETVIVGLQPEVAFAMVQLGLTFEDMHTALDLEEGLAWLNRLPSRRRDGRDSGR
ncbi:hypothetical protein ACWDNR_26400, partial [Gordonia aichiensis]